MKPGVGLSWTNGRDSNDLLRMGQDPIPRIDVHLLMFKGKTEQQPLRYAILWKG